MNVKNGIQCNIHNKFNIEVIDGKTGKIKQTAKAYNMVLDNLWHYLIETTTAFGTNIQYGSGTGTIQSSDISLFNRYSGKRVTQDSLTCDYANKIITRQVHINLPLTEAAGVTITEVGLAADAGNGTLTTHAMLQDMNGNIISISKTELDIINIYATIYCHYSFTSSSIEFYPYGDLNGNLTGGRNDFNTFKAGVSHNNFEALTIKTWSKTHNLTNKTITYTMPRYNQDEGNINGIRYFIASEHFQGLAIVQGNTSWSDFAITNEAVGTGDGSTVKFKTKFHNPHNAKIYINGLEQSSGVNIKEMPVSNNPLIRIIDIDNSTDGNLKYKPYLTSDFQDQIFYNPYYNNLGIDNFYVYDGYYYTGGIKVEVSNDLENWTVAYDTRYVSGSSYTATIPAQYKQYKYFKVHAYHDASGGNDRPQYNTNDLYNIVFDTPPAVGDVITIDYDTNCIPKDEDHVLDATITFRFGDYTP